MLPASLGVRPKENTHFPSRRGLTTQERSHLNVIQSFEMRIFAVNSLPTGVALSVLSLFGVSVCMGQGSPLTPGTVVTGQCDGHSEPGCSLPNLFGRFGLTLFPNPGFPHYAHFIGSAQTTLNQTLSTAIATQLAILPIISPSSAFTYKYDSAAGAFVRTTTSFGPIYAERAETIGRGKVSFGTSYQRFRFSTIDGIDLHKIPAAFTHVPDTGPGGTPAPYEADVIQTTNNVDLKMDQTMLFGTVGITRSPGRFRGGSDRDRQNERKFSCEYRAGIRPDLHNTRGGYLLQPSPVHFRSEQPDQFLMSATEALRESGM